MSRVGKEPINIPEEVEVNIGEGEIAIKGPQGELIQKTPSEISFTISEEDGKKQLLVRPNRKSKKTKALWGLYRALVANMIKGVINGFEKRLEIQGVGYRAAMQEDKLVLNLGFSHPIEMSPAEGISFAVDKNIIIVSGINKQVVGQAAAEIRACRKPEPYKGKGIRYEGEAVRMKAGKKTAATE